MRKKSDNRGATLVLVITTIALVSILVTVILAMSLMNLQMKTVNKNATDNFYDAESALDEIRTGLQQEVSLAASAAYVEVMTRYSETNYQDSQRLTIFNAKYKEKLWASLEDPSDTTIYSIAKLTDYISTAQKYNNATKTGAKINNVDSGLTPIFALTSQGLVLKNVDVTYHGVDNYVSEIQTDIVLGYPEMDFTQPATVPDVLKYCLVGNTSIISNAGTITVDGNVYAGVDGLICNNADNFTIQEKNTVITKGNLLLNSGSVFHGSSKVELWANDIIANNNTQLKVMGTTYVADDLEVTGSAKIDLNGEYYGYGNPITAKVAESKEAQTTQTEIEDNPSAYSSSIIVNGISTSGKTNLYMSGLTKLVLAGNAYIGNHTMMGESLSVKSNQIAYMVPEAYLPIGETNPSTNNNLTIDMTGLAADCGAAGYNKMTNASTGLTYYFMNFSNAKAATTYFDNYYDSSTASGQLHIKRRNQYLSFYINDSKLTIRQSTKFEKDLNGNILIWDENGIYSVDDTIAENATDISGDSSSYYYKKETGWQDMYAAYGINLTSDYGALKNNSNKMNKDVFENLVLIGDGSSDGLLKLMQENPGKVVFSYSEGSGTDAVTYEARAYNNAATSPVEVKPTLIHPDANTTVCMIIATGDVKVTTDFSGIIIAKGTITIEPAAGVSASIQSDTDSVAKLINYGTYSNISGTTFSLFDYMVDAGEYTGNISGSGSTENLVDFADLVTYANWIKE